MRSRRFSKSWQLPGVKNTDIMFGFISYILKQTKCQLVYTSVENLGL